MFEDWSTLLTLVGMVGTTVWAVAQIKSSTRVLSVEMRHLTKTLSTVGEQVVKVDERVDGVDRRVNRHGVRLAVIETKIGSGDENERTKGMLDT